MISSLGETSVASVGVANQFFFLFNMSLSGITGGAGVFISQFYGKKDVSNKKSHRSYLCIGNCFKFCICYSCFTNTKANYTHIFV
ncbi:MATE family efflux transporter [Clostridioides difficile]|uniref:MATE family efflux transporter n=1 Tax=Clostridioides difficile TaxID=1496 RepID=UPI00355C7858